MKILQITSYPIVNPLHGGQIRAAQIAKLLRGSGHEVETLAIYIGAHFKDAQDTDIALDLNERYFTPELAFVSDYMAGVYAVDDKSLRERVASRIRSAKADVVLLEHPWFFRAVKACVGANSMLVYSSHNIEWRLKRDGAPLDGVAAPVNFEAIRELEVDAASGADLIVACTPADAAELKSMAAHRRPDVPVIVCGNGVEPFSCSAADVMHWRRFFVEAIGAPYPVFVSSGHPPNAAGFWKMLAPGLTFLRPNEEVVVIGGVCTLVTKEVGINRFRELNLSRLHLVGTRPKHELQAMVKASRVVLLPIAAGEGSNLKTAEALESDCSIVGTSRAFRGFEDALDLPQVSIADTAAEFRRAVRKALDSPANDRKTPTTIRSSHYWSSTLKPLLPAFSAL